MKKPYIPTAKPGDPPSLEPIRRTIQIITGESGGKIKLLGETATQAEIIAKLNEVIARLMD